LKNGIPTRYLWQDNDEILHFKTLKDDKVMSLFNIENVSNLKITGCKTLQSVNEYPNTFFE
jgi:hypothetical protein